MTQKETIQVLAILKGAYPQFYKDMNKSGYQSVIALWQNMFADDDPRVVAMAVKAHIAADDKGFPPVIGQIKKRITQITEPPELSEMEAWGLVRRAISNGIYNSKEEFDKLPPIIQRVVGEPSMLREWALMDVERVQTVVQSNFMRSYKTAQIQHKEMKALPPDVKNYISQIADGFSMDRAIEAPKREG